MAKFRYINHTADVEFRAYGPTLTTALSNSFYALFDTIAYVKKVSHHASNSKVVRLKVHAKTIEDLIWQSLQSALSLGDARGIFFYRIRSIGIKKQGNGYNLSVILLGKNERPEYSKFEVKGISRYNLSLKRRGKLFIINIVVDV
ncbi:MAG: archease [Candidatus Micrarchaeaceae archaeon]